LKIDNAKKAASLKEMLGKELIKKAICKMEKSSNKHGTYKRHLIKTAFVDFKVSISSVNEG
jgi:hypothetical protein